MAVALAACEPTELRPLDAGAEAVARGREATERLGCGACHAIPGVQWPRGRVGPDLAGFGSRPLIAGALPNRPEPLAAFVRDAPSVVPGTAMPAIPMRVDEAQDIAAWLHSLHAR